MKGEIYNFVFIQILDQELLPVNHILLIGGDNQNQDIKSHFLLQVLL